MKLFCTISFFPILLVSCQKPISDNTELWVKEREIAEKKRKIAEMRDIIYTVKDFVYTDKYYLLPLADSLLDVSTDFPIKKNLLQHIESIVNISKTADINNNYSTITDTIFKYLPAVRERYIRYHTKSDSLQLLFMTTCLEYEIMYSYRILSSIRNSSYHCFPQKRNYVVGDTVVLKATLDTDIELVPDEFSFEHRNSTVINKLTKKEVRCNFSLTGPFVTVKFIPDEAGEYYISSDILQQVYNRTSVFGHIRHTITVY